MADGIRSGVVAFILSTLTSAMLSRVVQGEIPLEECVSSLIAKILFDNATDIVFYVGCAVNPAHQDEEFGFGFKRKMKIVDEIASALKKMGKVVTLKYF